MPSIRFGAFVAGAARVEVVPGALVAASFLACSRCSVGVRRSMMVLIFSSWSRRCWSEGVAASGREER